MSVVISSFSALARCSVRERRAPSLVVYLSVYTAICIVDMHAKKIVRRSRNSDVTITEVYAYETEVILARFSEK